MPRQLIRLPESRKSDDFDDQKSAAEIASSETTTENHQQFLNHILSQLKRVIYGDRPGNWHADIATVFGSDASLATLIQGATAETQAVEIDDLTDSSFYIGRAALDSLTSEAVWKIRKFEDVGNDVIEVYFADGSNDYDKVWDDRATYVYA